MLKCLSSEWGKEDRSKENAEAWGRCTSTPHPQTSKNKAQTQTSFIQSGNDSVLA